MAEIEQMSEEPPPVRLESSEVETEPTQPQKDDVTEIEAQTTPPKNTPERTSRAKVVSPKSAMSSRSSSGTLSENGSATRRSTEKKLPVRQGIIWKALYKLEAMDFLKKWYLAKIVEVDEDELEVLIHFEGWNSRFDEWLPMTSDRLRPVTRHSDRKESTRPKKLQHKVGERVLAKWTDCRMYPAKVTSLMPHGAYEVVFYDGFKRVVQPINIKPLPEELKAQQFDFAPSQPKNEEPGNLSKRKRTITKSDETERRRSRESVGEDKARKTEVNETKAVSSPPPSKRRKDVTPPRKKKPTKKVKLTSPQSKKTDKAVKEFKKMKASTAVADELKKKHDAATAQLIRRKRKLLIGGVFQAKRNKIELAAAAKKKEPSPTKPKPTSSEVKDEAVDTAPMSPAGEEAGAVQPTLTENTTALSLPESVVLLTPTPGLVSHGHSKDITEPPLVAASNGQGENATKQGRAPKEFKVEADHNLYKCPFYQCDKGFRKESLLKYHIKYYHLEDGSPVPVPAPRKRKATLSICSTDSDVSVGSKSGVSSGMKPAMKKKRVTSAPSVLENVPSEGAPSEVGEEVTDIHSDSEQRSVSASVHDDLEEDSEREDEVVNCVCGYNEENGLMIQCDVCLCWQHATCFDLTVETLPKKYICYVCVNPPGVRDSARYMHNQDYFKYGQLARFSFLPGHNDEETCNSILSSHRLMGDMINIEEVLVGLRRKTHMLENSDEEEFRIWQTNWDSYTREDIDDQIADRSTDLTGVNSVNLVGQTNIEQNLPVQVEKQSEPINNLNQNSNCDPAENTTMNRQDSLEHIDVCGESADEAEKPAFNQSQTLADSNTKHNSNENDTCHQSDSVTGSKSDRPTSLGIPSNSLASAGKEAVYKLSPVPTHVRVTGSSLWTPVAKNLSQPDLLVDETMKDDINNNLEVAEQNLKEHIKMLHEELEVRMDLIEQQLSVLENQFSRPIGSDPLSDLPVVKKSLRTFISDLGKVRKMAAFHC